MDDEGRELVKVGLRVERVGVLGSADPGALDPELALDIDLLGDTRGAALEHARQCRGGEGQTDVCR